MCYHSAKSESVNAYGSSGAGRANSSQSSRFLGLQERKKIVVYLASLGFVFPAQSRTKAVSSPLQPHQHSSCVCHLSGNAEQNVDIKNPQRLQAHVWAAPRRLLLLPGSDSPSCYRCSNIPWSAGPKYGWSSACGWRREGSKLGSLHSGACLWPCTALMRESRFESKPFDPAPQ